MKIITIQQIIFKILFVLIFASFTVANIYAADGCVLTVGIDGKKIEPPLSLSIRQAICINNIIYECVENDDGTKMIKPYNCGVTNPCNISNQIKTSIEITCGGSNITPTSDGSSINTDDGELRVCGDGTSEEANERRCCGKSSIKNSAIIDDGGLIGRAIENNMNKVKNSLDIKNEEQRDPCVYGIPAINGNPGEKINPDDPQCECIMLGGNEKYFDNFCPISHLSGKELSVCKKCLYDGGFWTAMGCIYFGNWRDFVEKNILGKLYGMSGIISLLCIIYGAITIQMSAGNPEKIKNGKQLITACITGLILIIFSVFILRFIGVDILRLPGIE